MKEHWAWSQRTGSNPSIASPGGLGGKLLMISRFGFHFLKTLGLFLESFPVKEHSWPGLVRASSDQREFSGLIPRG